MLQNIKNTLATLANKAKGNVFQEGKTAKPEYYIDLNAKGTTKLGLWVFFDKEGTMKGQHGFITSAYNGVDSFATNLISKDEHLIQLGNDDNQVVVKLSADYQCISIGGDSHCGHGTVNFIGFEPDREIIL